jgi:hypothetical protein
MNPYWLPKPIDIEHVTYAYISSKIQKSPYKKLIYAKYNISKIIKVLTHCVFKILIFLTTSFLEQSQDYDFILFSYIFAQRKKYLQSCYRYCRCIERISQK